MREKAIVSWSGGEDSALALYEVAEEYDIAALHMLGEYVLREGCFSYRDLLPV